MYYHQDQLGSTRLLTNASGVVAATATYDPYGQRVSSTGTVANPLGYAGQYTDAESGLQYLRARYYDPATAQFLTKDPLVAISQEPYGYVGNNPLNATDPSGLFCVGSLCTPKGVGDALGGAWDATGGKAVSYVDDHKVGIMQGGSIVLGIAAIFVSGGTAPLLLAGGSALLAVGSEAADSKPCRSQRVAQTAALAGVGLVGGVLWQGASQAARMASHAPGVGAGTAKNIGRVFGAGDVAANLLPDPCSC
jgi:RHS repeat-associated protein